MMLRPALLLALALAVFAACFVEDVYLARRPLAPGDSAPFTLRSPLAIGPEGPPPEGGAEAPPPSAAAFLPGEVVVPFRKTLEAGDLERVRAFEARVLEAKRRQIPQVVWTCLFMVVFVSFFLLALPRAGYRRLISRNLLLTVLILYGLVIKLLLMFTTLPVEGLPVALLPLLVIALNQGRITAIGLAVPGAAVVGLFTGQAYGILLNHLVVCLTVAMVFPAYAGRASLVLPAVLAGVVGAVGVMTLEPDWGAWIAALERAGRISPEALPDLAGVPVIARSAWAFAGGLLAGLIAAALRPAVAAGRQIASALSMRRFSDLDHPLLRRLHREAPGTYQHAMNVASLAQTAGAAVGADPLLLRVGAYFHDVGKLAEPRDFIENQINCENPHDRLDPYDSIAAIRGHVDRGVDLAEQAGLPREVIDLVRQHHGTLSIDFFYHKALKTKPKGSVQEEDFRYAGPKPGSLEAAVLMIADAVEAASRSLREPNRRDFDRMVRLIVLKRIADGQLSECALDTRDIDRIIRALVDALEALFHTRIPYPWQQAARNGGEKRNAAK
jgi:putative nucleotidyltransferase with HDIG domain